MGVGSITEIVDDHVSMAQCKKAVDALLKHAKAFEAKREEHELLPGKEQHVWLVLAVKRMQPEKKLKPFKIPIAHPLVDPRTSPVCLITKDPQREYKDLVEKHGIKFISRVVGVEKLKGKFKPFEARRMLLRENGLFLADERVIPLLPKLLGKSFFEAKKQPIPVNLTKKDLKGELERAISSTYMHQNKGTCTSIKVGTVSQTSAQVLENVKIALPVIVKRIDGGWDNVQSFALKTSSSVALPLWSCQLEDMEGGRWAGLRAEDDEANEEEEEEEKEEEDSEDDEVDEDGEPDESDEEEDTEVHPPPRSDKAGRKRPAEDDLLIPSKKAKGAETNSSTTAVAKVAKSIKAPAKSKLGATKTAQVSTKPNSSKTVIKKAIQDASVVAGSSKTSAKAAESAEGASTTSSGIKASTKTAAKRPVESPPAKVRASIAKNEKGRVPATGPAPLVPGPKSAGVPKGNTTPAPSAVPVLGPVSVDALSLSKDELKAKRLATAGVVERKKAKVVKARAGKSAKEKILGKRI